MYNIVENSQWRKWASSAELNYGNHNFTWNEWKIWEDEEHYYDVDRKNALKYCVGF